MLLDGWFYNGAGSAGYNVLPDILTKFRTIKILLQYAKYFLYSEMSSEPTVSAPPKSSWNAQFKEHKCVPGGITVHPEGENLELACLLGVLGICNQILDHSCRYVTTPMSHAHKS